MASQAHTASPPAPCTRPQKRHSRHVRPSHGSGRFHGALGSDSKHPGGRFHLSCVKISDRIRRPFSRRPSSSCGLAVWRRPRAASSSRRIRPSPRPGSCTRSTSGGGAVEPLLGPDPAEVQPVGVRQPVAAAAVAAAAQHHRGLGNLAPVAEQLARPAPHDVVAVERPRRAAHGAPGRLDARPLHEGAQDLGQRVNVCHSIASCPCLAARTCRTSPTGGSRWPPPSPRRRSWPGGV